MGWDQKVADLWELPLLWISDTAQLHAFLPGLSLELLPALCCKKCACVRQGEALDVWGR